MEAVSIGSPTEPTTRATVEEEPLQPAASLGEPVVTREWHVETQSGYTGTWSVSVYAPADASAIPALPVTQRTVLSCSVNPQVDVVVPVSFAFTNTTERFDIEASVQFNLASWKGDSLEEQEQRPDHGYWGDVVVGGGGRCTDTFRGSDAFLYSALWSSVPPGATISDDFFVVIGDYYSPNMPDGDRLYLAKSTLRSGAGASGEGFYGVDEESYGDIPLAGG